MKERRNFVQQLLNELELEGENLPGSSLVEIAGNQRVLVEKHFDGERTRTRLTLLSGEDRVNEIARMLGGDAESARKHAKEMIRG